jgi:hypothetical protein
LARGGSSSTLVIDENNREINDEPALTVSMERRIGEQIAGAE